VGNLTVNKILSGSVFGRKFFDPDSDSDPDPDGYELNSCFIFMVNSLRIEAEDRFRDIAPAVDAEGILLMIGTTLGSCEFTAPLPEDSLIAGF
jgi:hypothetical protein